MTGCFRLPHMLYLHEIRFAWRTGKATTQRGAEWGHMGKRQKHNEGRGQAGVCGKCGADAHSHLAYRCRECLDETALAARKRNYAALKKKQLSRMIKCRNCGKTTSATNCRGVAKNFCSLGCSLKLRLHTKRMNGAYIPPKNVSERKARAIAINHLVDTVRVYSDNGVKVRQVRQGASWTKTLWDDENV